MTTKAVSYLRVSGDGQIEGDGFPRQRERVAAYAAAHKLTIVDEYREEGVSGKNEMENRPSLAALYDRIASNGVRTVLVESASRLARDLMVSEIILAEFRKLGVTVIECDGGNDLTVNGDENPTAVLIRQILGSVSQFEKTVLVLKLRAARQRIRRTGGKCEGRKGYSDTEVGQQTLAYIKSLRRKPRKGERMTIVEITARLNAENATSKEAAGVVKWPTLEGGDWQVGTVQRILKRMAA